VAQHPIAPAGQPGANLPGGMKRISRQWSEPALQITRVQYVSVPSRTEWKPEMNVYRCHDRLIVSLDAAGVDLSKVHVEVRTNGLRITGQREAPEPECEHKVLQILALEIDHGHFERQIRLPFRVIKDDAKIEYRDGFLCVELKIAEN
jgi:HSP20 family molecular chaperone IbpA